MATVPLGTLGVCGSFLCVLFDFRLFGLLVSWSLVVSLLASRSLVSLVLGSLGLLLVFF